MKPSLSLRQAGRWQHPGVAADLVTTELFRALAVLRVVLMLFAVIKNYGRIEDFRHAWAGWVVIGVILGWTALMTWAYDEPRRRRLPLYLADLAVATTLVLVTPLVETQAMLDRHAAHLATFWVIPAVLAWAVGRGWVEGLAAALVVSLADVSVKVSLDANTFGNIFLLLMGAGMVGYAATTLRRAAELRAVAERESAAAAERARLARVVHDGVLQLLALVQRRAGEPGADLSDLAVEAREQEQALRALMQGAARPPVTGDEDLVTAIAALAGPRVTVSGPGHAVSLDGAVAHELAAAVHECLVNVRRHVGEDAEAFVLVEDLPGDLVVTVRDNGPGIPPDRLEAAALAGRLGVVESIRGRLAALGGRAELLTGPGLGTEWELHYPR
ncbi:MAG: DUF5931 domain-containing protein [Nocardioidaceae bacterium]